MIIESRMTQPWARGSSFRPFSHRPLFEYLFLVLDHHAPFGLDLTHQLADFFLGDNPSNPESTQDRGKVEAGNAVFATIIAGPFVVGQQSCAGPMETHGDGIGFTGAERPR